MAASYSSPLLKRLLSRSLPVRSMTLPASSRISTTNAAPVYETDDGDFDSDDVDVSFFCPFYGRFVKPEGPLDGLESSPAATGIEQNCETMLTAEGLHLLMDMPGLSKENVKLKVKENKLIVKGEGTNEFGDKLEVGRSYSGMIDLPSEKLYDIKAMKAEMKNGVLKAFVPKIKDEERTDVFNVSIE